jgi:hypothetical protein
MKLKRLIFFLFLLIALNSYYQPVQANNIRFRHTIVRQINFEKDELTKQLVNKNEKILFKELCYLNIQIIIADRIIEINNTS